MSRLVLFYAGFAALATLANLFTQRLVLNGLSGSTGLLPAMVCGTLVGLVVKYVLDKRWIFHDVDTGIAQHGRKFTLYSLMGVGTTLVFWGSETLFWLIWKKDELRELGAILGLAVGYGIKYRLDKRFVFADQNKPDQELP